RQVTGADDVVQDGLGRIVLHERHLLVSRRVEHDFRPMTFEQPLYPIQIANIRNDFRYIGEVLADFASRLVQVVFVLVEKNQVRWLELSELTNELRANPAARTRDEDSRSQ